MESSECFDLNSKTVSILWGGGRGGQRNRSAPILLAPADCEQFTS